MHGIKPDASFLMETRLCSSSIVHINMNGLHVLIGEVDVVWMPNELTKNLQTCIQYMYMMLENGTLGPNIDNAFG